MDMWFARSAWLWTEASRPATPADLASFAARNMVRDAWVSVPWAGPTRATAAHVRALGGRGIRAACLGGDATWSTDADAAAAWADRATASGMFTSVHLDIEPWALPEWTTHADVLLTGLARTVSAVAAASRGLPVEVDLPGWVARTHPAGFDQAVRAADRVTIMAFRDTAAAIADEADAAVAVAAGRARTFRVGVDTVPSPRPETTFHDDGRDALARHTSAVALEFARLPGFAGIAVHNLAAWRELRP
ncbi:hypothetical protein [Microbacterium thalassium]|uniref:Uncharacterized protein n=1 Tax=Microbacterium thalassium TaxID=362649 RepID=A0A7X0FNP3_9MICO|nr:hypothetical protein [Microbacterium thalassium]MBB6390868.1 hypothetical protein [Microbacterium thalassium]GLK25976.1 hypothetical protein GCM10017607_32950 [Microbacterium thalassium]